MLGSKIAAEPAIMHAKLTKGAASTVKASNPRSVPPPASLGRKLNHTNTRHTTRWQRVSSDPASFAQRGRLECTTFTGDVADVVFLAS